MKIVAVLCLTFTIRTSGQTTYYPPPLEVPAIPTAQSQLPNALPSVVIESWRYDPLQKTLTLHLVNRSNKDVTAFNISIAEKYADGSTDYVDGRPNSIGDHQVMEDMLGAVIQRQLTKDDGRKHGVAWTGAVAGPVPPVRYQDTVVAEGNGMLAAGSTHDYMNPEAKDIADIEAVVDVVAYADGTADVQNDRAFRNLLAERKGPLLAMQKVVEVIKQVLADPMVTNPVDSVIQQLTPLVDSADKMQNLPPEEAESNVGMHVQNDLTNFQMVQRSQIWFQMNMTEREWLTHYVEQHEKRIALMAPHANLLPEAR